MPHNGKTILIVDDSLIVAHRVRILLLGQEGIGEVAHAVSYADALAFLSAHRADIALLDIQLPDGNGIELLRYVKQHFPGVQVVMVSNQSNELYRIRCKTLGARHFLDKSTEFDQLTFIIPQLLQVSPDL